VRQVGYLPELYEDARPKKYKKRLTCLMQSAYISPYPANVENMASF